MDRSIKSFSLKCTIIPTSIWLTRSLIGLAVNTSEGSWAQTGICRGGEIVRNTRGIILTRFEHVAWIVGNVAARPD